MRAEKGCQSERNGVSTSRLIYSFRFLRLGSMPSPSITFTLHVLHLLATLAKTLISILLFLIVLLHIASSSSNWRTLFWSSLARFAISGTSAICLPLNAFSASSAASKRWIWDWVSLLLPVSSFLPFKEQISFCNFLFVSCTLSALQRAD